jgi:hypothetical protein
VKEKDTDISSGGRERDRYYTLNILVVVQLNPTVLFDNKKTRNIKFCTLRRWKEVPRMVGMTGLACCCILASPPD